MRIDDDDFTLLGLPQRQAQDRAEIDARWRQLQAAAHPDRHAADGVAAQRVAMQWAMRINEAHRRLKDPLTRAAYLCELRGVPVDAERNTAMPPDFLMQQMAWREALDDAIGAAEVEALDDRVSAHERAHEQRLQELLDVQQDSAAAAAEVRALMFVRRFREDLGRRLERLEN